MFNFWPFTRGSIIIIIDQKFLKLCTDTYKYVYVKQQKIV